MTAAEYLLLERAAEVRSDLCDGRLIPRPESSITHNRIVTNLIASVGGSLRGEHCETLSCNQRVGIPATGFYSYPDMLILCDRPQFDPLCDETLTNPRVIIEIVSPTSGDYDLGRKIHHYQKSPTVAEYAAVFENLPLVMHYRRSEDDKWLLRFIDGLDAEFALTTVPVRIPLTVIYRDIVFPPPTLKPRTSPEP